VKVTLPPLHPGQLEVARSRARFTVLVAGRRWGKTRLGSVLVLAGALERRLPHWWVAPDYPTAQVGWEEIKQLARQIPGAQVRESERRVMLPGGGWVQVKSANDPDSLRGRGLAGVVLDEAAFTAEEAWQVLRPSLAEHAGWALFISTPCGYNWFYEAYRDAGQRPGWSRCHYPTWTNPHIPAVEIERLKQELGSVRFAQEVEASFIGDAEHPFRPEWFAYYEDLGDHYLLHSEQGLLARAKADCQLVQAVDLAVSLTESADYLVILTLAATGRGERLVFDVYRDRVPGPDQPRLIQAQYARFKPDLVAVEHSGYQLAVIQQLRRLGSIPVKDVVPKGDKLARSLEAAVLYENHQLYHPRQADWLHAFERELIEFPLGRHDDQVDALAYATSVCGLQNWYEVYGIVNCDCGRSYIDREGSRPCPHCGRQRDAA
jgi:predicted phage terminase large subunit-like protein